MTREVRANLVYREFTGVGGGKVPDDKTIGRLARQLGSEAIGQLHRRTVAIALEQKVVAGRRMRVDTTVVETNIHYPADSTLMGDGVRVLTRVMKKASAAAGEAGAKFRDRSRSVKRRILEIADAARNKSEKGQEKMKAARRKLLEATSRVVGQAKKFSGAIAGKAARVLAFPSFRQTAEEPGHAQRSSCSGADITWAMFSALRACITARSKVVNLALRFSRVSASAHARASSTLRVVHR